MNAWQIYTGSEGKQTRDLYAQLEALGTIGVICLNLFRACKCSGRAKTYRTRRHRHDAYGRKDWSLGNLCEVLTVSAAEHGIVWGWKLDPAQAFHCWVLYIDIPTGQVSYHAQHRTCDQDYPGEWDRQHLSAERVIRWTSILLGGTPLNFEAILPTVEGAPNAAPSTGPAPTGPLPDLFR